MAMDFSKHLNERQLQAVTAPDGPVLVIAAAGTGKTRTLTHRVAYLVGKGVDPRRILLLTFTNRAAAEMLDRARGLVGDAVSGLWGGTFHHLANRLLRRHADRLRYGLDYTILDRDDSRRLLRQCTDDLGLKDKHFPKPEVLLSMTGLSSAGQADLESLVEERFEYHAVSAEDVLAVLRQYDARKRDMNAMDFDDLLANGWRLLAEHRDLRDRYGEQFLHVLVDEYQDTNPVQCALVDALAEKSGNLMVVGDDFQSIYSWRGADYRNILDFPEKYPETQIYKLETNYRSTPGILNVANACIAGNPEQFQKTLRAVREEGLRPRVARLGSGREQAQYIIERARLLRAAGVRLSEIAILYRSHYHSMELQLELAPSGLPYVITSGMRFFEQAHIKDLCALLRLIANPGDELSFVRLLTMMPRVGQKTAEKIWERLDRRFNPLAESSRAVLDRGLPAPAAEMWAGLRRVFEVAERDGLKDDPGGIVDKAVKEFYDEYAVETFDNYDSRIEDIDELIRYTGRFPSVEAFLSDVALLSSVDAEAEGVGGERAVDGLRLSTIHQAKGLEWPVVFVLWAVDGLFPSGRSLESPGGEAEERRLFYVAVTRAKDELTCCVPTMRRDRDGKMTYYSPSRFLKELNPDLMDEERLPAGASSFY
jgi:DNA helicase II / ATP-dependent DNA helicase PcrA